MEKIRIAFLLPSLANKGPISVAKDIVSNIDRINIEEICIFYFDDIEEVSFNIKTKRVSFWDRKFLIGYDIVHCHGLRPDLYVRLFGKGIKSVTTTHNVIFEEYNSNYNSFIAKLVEKIWGFSLRKHDRVVSLTNIMASYYRKLLKRDDIQVINNGRRATIQEDTISYEDRQRLLALKHRYRILGTACVVNKRKGLQQIIEVLPKLENIFFIVIGEGEELLNLKRVAKENNIEDRCWFMGYKSNATTYYPFFDYYIIASYAEGLPLALLEAASLGIPSICSSIPVHREVFDDSEVSFFELDNKDSLIEALTNLESNKDSLREKMLERYRNNYTPEVMADKYLQLYKNLISKQ